MYTPVKHVILSLIAFIRHDIYVQIKQNGTHRSTMFHNIQALLNMSQPSHSFHVLIMFFNIHDKEIHNLFGSVSLFKRFTIWIRLKFVCLD